MKYILLLLAVLALMAMPAAALNISVMAPSVIHAGEDLDVQIFVGPGATNISGIQTSISYDPAMFTFGHVTEGPLLSSSGGQTFFSAGGLGFGKITNIMGVILGNVTASSPGTSATVTLHAVGAGRSTLTLSGTIIGSPNGTSISVSQVNASIQVKEWDRFDLNHDGNVDILDVILIAQAVR